MIKIYHKVIPILTIESNNVNIRRIKGGRSYVL